MLETIAKSYFLINFLGATYQIIKSLLGKDSKPEYEEEKHAKELYEALDKKSSIFLHILIFILNLFLWFPFKLVRPLILRK